MLGFGFGWDEERREERNYCPSCRLGTAGRRAKGGSERRRRMRRRRGWQREDGRDALRRLSQSQRRLSQRQEKLEGGR